ncbi:MAG TPA: N,N-dimethylformamidase beta subunit family domain-containing protein, partial [Actinomycetota bacterium]|nr:N,N-dimethylformamidase beta subunit family domain-containing protein [Actinomycetota bacterium]
IPNLVGYEYDKTFAGQDHPAGIVDVARSPLTCSGRQSESDSTFYIAPSGAAVFDAGTLDLVCALGPTSHACQGIYPDAGVQKLVGNLIDAMLAHRFT